MQTNNQYLNKTINKFPRGGDPLPEFVIWHETANPSGIASRTLTYNLTKPPGTSYNYLISRTGTIYWYVDERSWISYHAGVASSARGYTEYQVNVHSIGVELDGPNDGKACTPAQLAAAVDLLRFFATTYQIPIDRAHHLEHKQVAPTHKSDPKGYSVDQLLELASLDPPPVAPPSLDEHVIGVMPKTTIRQFTDALVENKAPLSTSEISYCYGHCLQLEIEPSFMIAVWAHESGTPLGGSPLQKQTHMPINARTIHFEGRRDVLYKAGSWMWAESFFLGFLYGLWHIKNYYGGAGLLSVRQIIPAFAPKTDGNDPEAYIKAVFAHMAFIRNRTPS